MSSAKQRERASISRIASRSAAPAVSCARLLVLGLAGIDFLGSDASALPLLQNEMTLTLPRESQRGSRPVSVTTGFDGMEICVTDGTSNSGQVFNASNVHVFSTGLTADLAQPIDITIERNGGFVCTDSRPEGGRTIRRLNLYGEPETYQPESPVDGWQPEHLLLTRDGNYVTTDAAHSLLAKHDSRTGALIWKKSLKDNESDEVLGLGKPAESPDGRLYLPLGGDHMISVLTAEGEPESTFGLPGTGLGRLSSPEGVAFCPDGTIAVLDRMRNVILLYSADHVFQSEFGEYGRGPRNLYQPAAIAATSDGRIYVAQGFQGWIHVFRYSTTSAASSTNGRSHRLLAGWAGAHDVAPEGGGWL